MNANPLLQALEQARLDAQVRAWESNEAALHDALSRRLGAPPRERPETPALLMHFRSWCGSKGVRYCPAHPAALAQYILDHDSHGVEKLAEFIADVSELYSALGLPNPAATWIVAAALDRIGDIAPPRSWPRDRKACFALLPLSLKRYIVAHDAQREKVLRKAQNEAARARRTLPGAKPRCPAAPENSEIGGDTNENEGAA